MTFSTSKLYIFSDFDGTISLEDLGDEVFRYFGTIQPYNSQLKNKEIDIVSYWHKVCNEIKEGTTIADIENFVSDKQIDYNFPDFADWTEQIKANLFIVSDGFDSYIKPILEREKLNRIKLFSNSLIDNNGKIEPVFYNRVESCKCFSASCKRNSVLTNLPDDAISVYIGDGFSDFCPAEYVDIVFAKKNLAKYCNEHRITHYNFKTFFDVKILLEKAINDNKIKKKNRAEIKRKKAFEYE